MRISACDLYDKRMLPLRTALYFLMGLICAKSFVINPALYAGMSAVPAATTDYLWSFVGLCLTGLFYLTFEKRRCRPGVGAVVFGLTFGVANYFGMTLFAYDTWAFIGVHTSWAQVIFKCLGQGVTMMTALTLIVNWLRAGEPCRPGGALYLPAGLDGLRGLYRKHPALVAGAVCLLGWLPYMIAYFPGTPSYDIARMMSEYFGITPMTTWDGVFLTWVLGGLVSFGRLLGSDNIGIAIFMIVQALLMASACGLCVAQLRRLGLRPVWQLATMGFYAIVPFFGFYAEMICKDTLYSAGMMLMTVQTITLLREKTLSRARDWVIFGLAALLCCLSRNNGIYVVLPSAIIIVLFAVGGAVRLKAAAALGAAIVVTLLYSNVLIPTLGIVDTTASGIYSLAFQQTARTVRDHGDELTEDEKARIDQVLDVEQIGVIYEPWISDPVKYTFRQFGQGEEAEKAALKEYRSLWLELFRKYPLTYLETFVAGTNGYYAFTPMYEGMTYSQQAGARIVLYSYNFEGEGQLRTTQSDALQPLRNLLSGWALRWRTFPMLAMLYVCPFYTWLLIGGGIALAQRKRWRHLAAYAPALFSFAVCLLSPVNDYFRYFIPIIAMFPLLMGQAGSELLPARARP